MPGPIDGLNPNQAPPPENEKKFNGFQFQDEPTQEETDVSPYYEVGVSGLEQHSGYLAEEKLLQLRGSKAALVYRQMKDNDATIGAMLFAIEMMMRKVPWSVEPFSDDPDDEQMGEFVEECMYDMSMSWDSVIAEVVQMLAFGWSCLEICYKRRMGPDQTDPNLRSKFDDGLIGWRKLPGRAPESLHHWVFDNDGGIKGWWQWPPSGGVQIYLPIEKILLFRTTSLKNNPEGRSLLRNAYVSWFRKKEMERIEAIGVERDLAGLPLLYVQPQLLSKDADDNSKALLNGYKKIIRRLRQDEQSGLILPSMYDQNGHRLVEFSLVGTGSRRQNNTGGIIDRYSMHMAMSVLADFVLIGHEQTGSYALAETKTELFQFALGAFLNEIATVFNTHAIPRLLRINGFDITRCPKLVAGQIEKQDVKTMAAALQQIVTSGMITPGGLDDENFWRDLLGMPSRTNIPSRQGDPDYDPESDYLSPTIPTDPSQDDEEIIDQQDSQIKPGASSGLQKALQLLAKRMIKKIRQSRSHKP